MSESGDGQGSNGEQQKPPEFTLANVMEDVKLAVKFMVNDPQAINFYYVFTTVLESALCKIIVARVPYTEIDFVTYLQQVRLYKNGELDYSNIYGESGPIVYPAGFVHVYSLVETVYNSDGLRFVQRIFGYLLTATVLVYVFVYHLANRSNNQSDAFLLKKPWIFALLLLSKRIHSIYVLRLFNDCFVTLLVALTVLCLQTSTVLTRTVRETFPGLGGFLVCLGSVLYSLAVSIKMNSLLFAPGLFYVLYLLTGGNLAQVAFHGVLMVLVQVAVAWPFLQPFSSTGAAREIRNSYLANAFNFHRKFLYKWTINWKFLPESVFQNDGFHALLLVSQVALLLLFLFTRWSPNTSPITLLKRSLANPFKPHFKPTVNSAFIFYVLATCNLIGVLCSRSLHYQFLSWYYFQLPFLYALTGWNYYFIAVFHIAHEACWCTYPSNEKSSLSLVLMLAALLVSIWNNNYFKCFKAVQFAPNEKDKKLK